MVDEETVLSIIGGYGSACDKVGIDRDRGISLTT